MATTGVKRAMAMIAAIVPVIVSCDSPARKSAEQPVPLEDPIREVARRKLAEGVEVPTGIEWTLSWTRRANLSECIEVALVGDPNRPTTAFCDEASLLDLTFGRIGWARYADRPNGIVFGIVSSAVGRVDIVNDADQVVASASPQRTGAPAVVITSSPNERSSHARLLTSNGEVLEESPLQSY